MATSTGSPPRNGCCPSLFPYPSILSTAQKADMGKIDTHLPSHITAHTALNSLDKMMNGEGLAIKISSHLQKQEKHIINDWPLACQQLKMRILVSFLMLFL